MKIYIGTYRKYNEGSLRGGWVDLDRLTSYEDLRKAAHDLHRDETDPEYMVQDVECDGEDWQSGFTGENLHDYADYWQVKAESAKLANPPDEIALDGGATMTINEERNGVEIRFPSRPAADVLAGLKANGWRWSRFGGCWYTRRTPESERYAHGLCSGAVRLAASVPAKREPSPIGKLESWAKAGLADYKAAGHDIKDVAAAVKLSDGQWLTVGKSSIETKYCCGEDDRGQGGEGPGTIAYAERRCSWFRTEAGFKIENNQKPLVGGPKGGKCGYGHDDWKRGTWRIGGWGLVQPGRYNTKGDEREITPEEWRDIRAAYAWAAIAKRRRVNAYWKRFGASKLRTWTYWTEA